MQGDRCRDGQQTGEPYRRTVVVGIACGDLRKDWKLNADKMGRQVLKYPS